jgi:simple sugar transport system permease protein
MEVLAGVVAAAAPLIYAVVGETITEKAGVVNLSLDGSIMLSAMVAFAAAATSGSVIVGFVAAMLVSMAIAGVVAFSAIGLRLNQIAVGFVLFLFAKQLALFFGDPYIGGRAPGRRGTCRCSPTSPGSGRCCSRTTCRCTEASWQ